MKTRSKIISALAAILLTGSLMADQQPTKFSDRLLLEVAGKALIPLKTPTGIGGGPAIGLAFRDFNLFLNPTFLLAEPTVNPVKVMIVPTVRLEVKFTLMPNFLTLLPFLEAGAINAKVPRLDGSAGAIETAMYAEFGSGVDIQLTHELSLIPRIGVAYAMLYSPPDSLNASGTTISLAMRYTFGRPNLLDY